MNTSPAIGSKVKHEPYKVTQEFFESWHHIVGGLPLEERGAYAQLCVIYVGTQRNVTDAAAAPALGVNMRKWKRLKETLLLAGAIRVSAEDGSVSIPALKGRVHRTGYAHVRKPISAKLRWAVFQRDGYQCRKCGSREDLTADHIDADILGGETSIDNLQTLCRPCNCSKGAR